MSTPAEVAIILGLWIVGPTALLVAFVRWQEWRASRRRTSGEWDQHVTEALDIATYDERDFAYANGGRHG